MSVENTNTGKKGRIFINTKIVDEYAGEVIPLAKYLDTLIRLLPAYSDKNLCAEISFTASDEMLAARIEHLRRMHDSRGFAVIISDHNSNNEDYRGLMTNTIFEKLGNRPLVDNYSFLYLDREPVKETLVRHKYFNAKATTNDNPTEGRFFPDDEQAPNDYWLRLSVGDLKSGLLHISAYLLRLAKELKLISNEAANSYTRDRLENLVDVAIDFTRQKIDCSCIDTTVKLDTEQRQYRNILLKNLKKVLDTTGLILENGILYFNETCSCDKWLRLEGKSLSFFPNSAYIQRIINKPEITGSTYLKTIFASLGLRVASPNEEIARYTRMLENNWQIVSDKTGIFRLPQADKSYKYYFYLRQAPTVKYPWPSIPGATNLVHFPSAPFIREHTDGQHKVIQSKSDNKQVWSALGLQIAGEEEDSFAVIKKLFDDNWLKIAKNTGVQKLPGENGREKLYFTSCNTEPEKWGSLGGIPLRAFPTKFFINQAIGKDKIETAAELRRVWKRLGFVVAGEKREEKLEHLKFAIIKNWDTIAANTGIQLLPSAGDISEKYYFATCKIQPQDWGLVGKIPLKDFPGADFIRSVIGKEAISDIDELKLVWKKLGVDNIADEKEEDFSLVRKIIEDNWDEIASASGIYRNLEGDKYQYCFDKVKTKPHLWGKVSAVPVSDFPSTAFVHAVINKDSITTIDELKQVWKRLGFDIASASEEQVSNKSYATYKQILESNIDQILTNTGIVREDGVLYFGDCVGSNRWGTLGDRPLNSFPSPTYLEGVINQRQLANIENLKKLMVHFGFTVATEEQERLRYGRILEDNWGSAKVAEGTQVRRIYDPELKKYKYYFLLAKANSVDHRWAKINGSGLQYYPGANIVKPILGKNEIASINDLKQVWQALGLEIATDEEDRTVLPKNIIEENWASIAANTGILKLPGLSDGDTKTDDKYYFSFAKASGQDWGRVPGHNVLKAFPSSAVIQHYINEPTVQSLANLKKMWGAFGMPIASAEEEASLPKRLIEANWAEISKNTGVFKRLVQSSSREEPRVKYFFSFAHATSDGGKVAGIRSVRNFPNPDFIRSVINKKSIQSIADMKKVWQALGLDTATEEEEQMLPKAMIEANWSEITQQTGILILPGSEGYKYYFRFAKPRSYWGKVSDASFNVQSYPSGPYVRSILSKKRPDTAKDLKKVWASLGIEVASEEEENNIARRMIEEFNWDTISKNTAITRIELADGTYRYDFTKLSDDPSKWGSMPGTYDLNGNEIPLSKFPGVGFIKEALGDNRHKKLAIESKQELVQVWNKMGLRAVNEETASIPAIAL